MKINDKIQTQTDTDDKTKWETSDLPQTKRWHNFMLRENILSAEPSPASQTQLEQIYDEDCSGGEQERRRDMFNWYNKEREGSECDSVENDEALGVRSRVTAIQPRVSRENWAAEHVATMPNIEETETGVGGGRMYQAENVPTPRTKHYLMRRENLKSESSVLWQQTVSLAVSCICWHLLWTIKIFSHKVVEWMHNVRVTHNDPNSNFIKCWPGSVSVAALTSSLVSIVSTKTRADRGGDNVALQFHQRDTMLQQYSATLYKCEIFSNRVWEQ